MGMSLEEIFLKLTTREEAEAPPPSEPASSGSFETPEPAAAEEPRA
jgi:hypothetical protein